MTAWPRVLVLSILLVTSACVSAGTKAITDNEVISKIEVGASTQSDVVALLGYPLRASYGDQGEQTWHYTYSTATPMAPAYVPLVKAFTPDLSPTTREFGVTFTREGLVKSLGPEPLPKSPGPSS
jgi:outer membrane protein assembly factor BamE (lipoprotein component of BamABCDE complex)